MDDCVEIIRSNKGGLKLIHKGYMYTVHKKRQNGGVRWRCTQRALHCKVAYLLHTTHKFDSIPFILLFYKNKINLIN